MKNIILLAAITAILTSCSQVSEPVTEHGFVFAKQLPADSLVDCAFTDQNLLMLGCEHGHNFATSDKALYDSVEEGDRITFTVNIVDGTILSIAQDTIAPIEP